MAHINFNIFHLNGKMALVCMACLPRPVVLTRLFVLMCFMLAILQNVSSLLTYDRQTLLGIKGITEELLHDSQCGAQFVSPLATIPDYLRRRSGPLQVFWRFILPVRFSYLGLLRMRTSILHPFSHAKQQNVMHLHYCKGQVYGWGRCRR